MIQDTQAIVIYTHPDCDASAEAKADFQKNGIFYREIDVTVVPGAVEELERLTGGKHITPVIIEGDKVIVGYAGTS